MAFTIPNDADAFNTNQAEPDKVDLDILTAAFQRDGVISGCAVTAQGSPDMTVAVAAGLIKIGDAIKAVTAGNVTITTANATNPRIDLIVVDNTGAKSATAGTAAAEPVFPAIPANSIVLATVYVPANDTTIASNQIIDKRAIIGGSFTVAKTADEVVNNSTTLQNDDHLKFDISASATEIWFAELFIRAGATTSTMDVKLAFTVPSGATMRWARIGGTDASATSNFVATATAGVPTLANTEGTTGTFGSQSTAATGWLMAFGAFVYGGGTAGTIQLQWAQNTQEAADLTFRAGSFLRLVRLVA